MLQFLIFDDHFSARVRASNRIFPHLMTIHEHESFIILWWAIERCMDGRMETSPSQKAHFYKFFSKENHFYFVRSHCSARPISDMGGWQHLQSQTMLRRSSLIRVDECVDRALLTFNDDMLPGCQKVDMTFF